MNEPATTEEGPTVELIASFSQVAEVLFAAGGVAETLQAVVDLAVVSIEGCEAAGILVGGAASPAAAVHSDPFAAAAASLQQRLGEGPCLDTLAEGGLCYAGDLIDEDRWTRFVPEAVEMGIRSVLALQLLGNGPLGLYSRFPLAFGIADRAKGLIFATVAGLALSAAHLHDDTERRLEQLHQALATRELIGQAQGILMERERITADQAFDILRVASQHLNVKLKEVARDLVETGETPSQPDEPLHR